MSTYETQSPPARGLALTSAEHLAKLGPPISGKDCRKCAGHALAAIIMRMAIVAPQQAN